jgi:predicted MFS family arabinose efflux permease
VAVGIDLPVWFVCVLSIPPQLGIAIPRPAQAALLPAAVETSEELTAANVMTGWTHAAGALAGPAVVGLILAASGVTAALASTAAMSAVAALLVSLRASRATARRVSAAESTQSHDVPARMTARETVLQVIESVRVTATNSATRVLLTLETYYHLLIGALDLLAVVLAVSVLHSGQATAGYLDAAVGAGAVLASAVSVMLIGRPRLAPVLGVALLVTAFALAILALAPSVVMAFVMITVVGLGGALFDVTARTLLQRVAPPEAIARSFAVLESLMSVGLLLGAVVVRAVIAGWGYRAGVLGPGIVGLVVCAVCWRGIKRMDAAAHVPHVEISLLRRTPIFFALPGPSIEALARELVPTRLAEGTQVVTEGEPGEQYYVVANGSLVVTKDGEELRTLERGDGFGEIALIRRAPRTATVTAKGEVLLYSLESEPFMTALTGHASTAARAVALTDGYVDSEQSVAD